MHVPMRGCGKAARENPQATKSTGVNLRVGDAEEQR